MHSHTPLSTFTTSLPSATTMDAMNRRHTSFSHFHYVDIRGSTQLCSFRSRGHRAASLHREEYGSQLTQLPVLVPLWRPAVEQPRVGSQSISLNDTALEEGEAHSIAREQAASMVAARAVCGLGESGASSLGKEGCCAGAARALMRGQAGRLLHMRGKLVEQSMRHVRTTLAQCPRVPEPNSTQL